MKIIQLEQDSPVRNMEKKVAIFTQAGYRDVGVHFRPLSELEPNCLQNKSYSRILKYHNDTKRESCQPKRR